VTAGSDSPPSRNQREYKQAELERQGEEIMKDEGFVGTLAMKTVHDRKRIDRMNRMNRMRPWKSKN
jgi:hypothetical protein